jgi:protein TonB
MVKYLFVFMLATISVCATAQSVPPADSIKIQANKPQQSMVEDSLFLKVDEEAKFPGGLMGWKNFLERNLKAEVAMLSGLQSGMYPVTVQFIVDKKGLVSQVKGVDGPKECPACIEEAVRVIKRGPKWIPAKLDGQPVKYQAYQKITFAI